MSSSIVSAFNNYLDEFVESVRRVFPDVEDIEVAQKAIQTLRKSNPKMVLLSFKTYLLEPYAKQIEDGDISFFIQNDYSNLVGENHTILEKIDILRTSVGLMGADDQVKVIKYLQNLKHIADLYNY